MKSIVIRILAFFARATIKRYKPIVIGVTGSAGKTSTKDAIYSVLKKKYAVRKNEKSLNTEIGLPLAILGAENHYQDKIGWLAELIKIAWRFLFSRTYPKVLVLEYGVQSPGDMDYLLSIARPNIAVVTVIGDVPVHVEHFKNPEELIAEKTKLVQSLSVDGHAVLNQGDFAVLGMKEKTKAHIVTFGTEEHASVCIVDAEVTATKNEQGLDIPDGTVFKIQHAGQTAPIRLHHTFGMPQVLATTAASAVGIVMDMSLLEISHALAEYTAPSGRLRMLDGVKNSKILDDTYNASPEAMKVAIETLHSLPGKRKIAVLGDMLEIGTYTEQVHRAIGDSVAGFVDILVCVGARANFIADEVVSRNPEHASRVLSFDNATDAGKALDPLIEEGDLILVKGSQGMRMERAVFEIMKEPERASELLVRQDKYWRAKN